MQPLLLPCALLLALALTAPAQPAASPSRPPPPPSTIHYQLPLAVGLGPCYGAAHSMPPRATKRPVPRPPRPSPPAPRPSPNPCRAIVPVDGSAIRKQLKHDYEKALRDLDRSRRVLDQFLQTDQLLFSRWMNTHFGALLTELRELNLKWAADDALIFQVENEVMFGGLSHARAYQRVMADRENPEPPPPPPGAGHSDRPRDRFGAGPDSGDAGDEADPLEDFFDALFDDLNPDGEPPHRRDRRGGPATGPSGTAHASKRLKELYRAVVRRLHPDSQPQMTPQKTEWWHQAQAAYEAGDAEQLEVILTLCEIGESGTTAHTSASLLQRITARLKSSLRELKRQIAQRRREPAWNFSGRTDHAVLAGQLRRELTAELIALRREYSETQAMLARWKAAAERLKPLRRRPRRSSDLDCPF